MKRLFRQFSPDELAFVTQSKIGQTDIRARDAVLDPDVERPAAYSLLAGWAFRFKTLPNGARQILDFLLPGDLIGFYAPATSRRLRQRVEALTDVTVCELAAGTTRRLFETQPGLAAALVQTLLIDDERADRRLLMLGRQRPTQRLVYLLLELFERLEQRQAVDGDACTLPVTYEHMSDALGVSRAQLARSLAELRDRGWASFRSGVLEFMDRPAMKEFAFYDGVMERERRGLI